MRRAALLLLWLSFLVALATVVGSGLLFSGVQNLPPLDYNRLSTQLGIALVVLGIGASLLHMAHTQGWRSTLWLLGICVVLAGTIELIGTLTGFPFGPYTYTERLGPKFLGHVPYLIPPSWFMMLYPALHLSFLLGVPSRWVPLSAAALLTLWDVAMDAAVSTSTGQPWLGGVRVLVLGGGRRVLRHAAAELAGLVGDGRAAELALSARGS
jgi:uncharacterized membrane protein